MSGNKIVRVTYYFEDIFKVPSNVDLENKEQVEDWWVRHNTLYIKLKNGNVLDIVSQGYEICMKTPNDEEILDAEDTGFGDEEFEEADLGEGEYMEEDMGECPKCDCPVKRKDLASRDYGYIDVCAKCDEEDDSDDDTFLGEKDTEEVVLKECKVTPEPASNEKIEQMWKAMGLPVASDETSDETSNEASDDETTHCNICLEPSTDKFDMKCDTCKEGYICSDCQNNIVPNGILWADADDVKSAIKCPCCRILNWKSYYSQFIEYGLNYDLEEYEPEEYNNAVQVYLRNKNL